jgi:shikimate kinase/3-dehydroquinate synthase
MGKGTFGGRTEGIAEHMENSASSQLKSKIFLYGPSGSGKSTLGRMLAENLALPFFDLDEIIVAQAGASIPEIFAREGETGFRQRERAELLKLLEADWGVIALGGGALLDPQSRAQVELAGPILCLTATPETLLQRLKSTAEERPLLTEDEGSAPERARLMELLAARAEHYASFPLQMDTSAGSSKDIAWNAQVQLGAFHVHGMGPGAGEDDRGAGNPARPQIEGYDVRVQPGGLDALGAALKRRNLPGPVALVTDENVGAIYMHRALKSLHEAGYTCQPVIIPAGEASKNVATVSFLWEAFLEIGLERGSPVVALGGGVVGDLAGFAAATYKRGVPWVVMPTTLLAMADASLGGKTGADLAQGKNLVGAFHAPQLVLTDPQTLRTLPQEELRSGLAEVVKAGIIGDPDLFARCARGWEALAANWEEVVRRAMAVKIQVIEADPYEQGRRAALNLGHTIGHALEMLSGYELRHGEAVAIGMVVEARIAEAIGLAQQGLADETRAALGNLGLPTEIPNGMDRRRILEAMQVDKKRSRGRVRFALPVRIGEVKTGIEIDDLEKVIS